MTVKKPSEIKCGSRRFALGNRTFIMGILNLTPDSFSDGGCYMEETAALKKAESLIEAGADVLDIGGESTRPFAKPISAAEELTRVLPTIKALVKSGIDWLSIDTRRAEVARVCLQEGVHWVNDVSALTYDTQMAAIARAADGIVLMHAKGTPETMQQGEIVYEDVVKEIHQYLANRIEFATQAGIPSERLLIDPGIGFGKTQQHNWALLKNLRSFQDLRAAGVVCGASRKSFLGELTGPVQPTERDFATTAVSVLSALQKVDWIRVHNVRATKEALAVVNAWL